MKIIYYVTDHGLGHASRSVALIRELEKNGAHVIIRNNDPLDFFKKSLPRTRLVRGRTDFTSVMDQKNGMKFDQKKTKQNLSSWIRQLPEIIKKELLFVKKEKPDIIVTDVSIMPILVAKKADIRSVVVSNFAWNETLNLGRKAKQFIANAYCQADLVIKLPFGTEMKFSNKKELGLVARSITKSRSETRKQLGVKKGKKLVLVSLSGLKIGLSTSKNVEILDVSNYDFTKSKKKIELVEGQNLINAADLVICKCGYGFISECLSSGTRFYYVLEPLHKEAKSIHDNLVKLGLRNKINILQNKKLQINTQFIKNSARFRMKNNAQKVAQIIMKPFE